MPVALVPLYV